MTLKSYLETKTEYAVKQVGDIYFQVIRGEDPTMVEMALQKVMEETRKAILDVKTKEGRH